MGRQGLFQIVAAMLDPRQLARIDPLLEADKLTQQGFAHFFVVVIRLIKNQHRAANINPPPPSLHRLLRQSEQFLPLTQHPHNQFHRRRLPDLPHTLSVNLRIKLSD
ncbi:MAG: hypothetical protein BWY71_00967 [Planctomycetes bacterium ADurb.Bin412]|nr:MAG: hypothetical protein BWY71_00967 [Planctomycetes bacterium ADurb.Bin412]